jgi:hypothetical protein
LGAGQIPYLDKSTSNGDSWLCAWSARIACLTKNSFPHEGFTEFEAAVFGADFLAYVVAVTGRGGFGTAENLRKNSL